jgi:hypothetical protein
MGPGRERRTTREVIALAPHDRLGTASTQLAADPTRRFDPAIAHRQLAESGRAGLAAIELTEISAVQSWPNRLGRCCNRQHRRHASIPLTMPSPEPHRSRSGHGRRKWLITTREWQVQMHVPFRLSQRRPKLIPQGYGRHAAQNYFFLTLTWNMVL